MPKSSFVDFKAVKAAITMEQVLEHYGLMDQFKRGTDSLSGPCPIHKGTNPTQFRVSISKNIWNCFSECKHGGNVLDFITRMENVTVHGAALKAIEWFHLDPHSMAAGAEGEDEHSTEAKPNGNGSTTRPAAAQENNAPNPPLKFRLEKLEREHPYLTERGLTLETIVNFGVGFCTKGMMANRVAIPIHNPSGEVVAYAGRFPGEPAEGTPRYKLPQGFRKSLELFNIDRAIKEPADAPLVVVEGFFGCMKLHQHGCRKVVALMGSTMSATQEGIIRKHTDRYSQVIIMLDGDEAGHAGSEDIVARVSRFCFVRRHEFDEPDMQPEALSADAVLSLFGT